MKPDVSALTLKHKLNTYLIHKPLLQSFNSHKEVFKPALKQIESLSTNDFILKDNVKRLFKISDNPNLNTSEFALSCIKKKFDDPTTSKIDEFYSTANKIAENLSYFRSHQASVVDDNIKFITKFNKTPALQQKVKDIRVHFENFPEYEDFQGIETLSEEMKKYICTSDIDVFIDLLALNNHSEVLTAFSIHSTIIGIIGLKYALPTIYTFYSKGHCQQFIYNQIYELNFKLYKKYVFDFFTNPKVYISTGFIAIGSIATMASGNPIILDRITIIECSKTVTQQLLERYKTSTDALHPTIFDLNQVVKFSAQLGFSVSKIITSFPIGFARGVADNYYQFLSIFNEIFKNLKK